MNTIYIIGDSTVEDNQPPFRGWGWALPQFVREGVRVKNHALSGRSSRSFRAEGLFEPVEQALGEGDLLLIQFGHNDGGNKPERHTEPWTSYTDNLTAFIRFARERGAVPALLTPICMRVWENGALQETHGEYKDAMRSLAIKMDVPLLDIYRDSFRIVAAAGEEGSKAFFMHVALGEDPRYPEGLSDNAHTRRAGAERFAACVAKQLIGAGLVSPQ